MFAGRYELPRRGVVLALAVTLGIGALGACGDDNVEGVVAPADEGVGALPTLLPTLFPTPSPEDAADLAEGKVQCPNGHGLATLTGEPNPALFTRPEAPKTAGEAMSRYVNGRASSRPDLAAAKFEEAAPSEQPAEVKASPKGKAAFVEKRPDRSISHRIIAVRDEGTGTWYVAEETRCAGPIPTAHQ